MSTSVIICTNCRTPLPEEALSKSEFTSCPFCKLPVMVNIFPAFFKKPGKALAGEKVLMDDEASCFFHPKKKAVVPCEICGRFLCSLCEVEFNNQHVCPTCIETGKKKRKLTALEDKRTLYDNIALSLAIIPMIFIWPVIISAPASIFISIRHWKSPASIIHKAKARFLLAIIISSAQLTVTGFVIARFLI